MSGSLSSLPDISKVFAKPAKSEATGTPGPGSGNATVPQVPIARQVQSPMRKRGRGKRDTILNGADGLPE